MEERAEHILRFRDGGTLRLGRRTAVMGILNITPDSFSDGGRNLDPAGALQAAERMIEAGVDIVDIGGESTRPGAAPVDAATEIGRVVPVIQAIRSRHDVRLSIDTMKAEVAREAIDAGADLVNDVSGLGDSKMLPLLVERSCPVVLMHRRGTSRTMQRDTHYDDLMATLTGYLQDRAETAVASGLTSDRIVLDPGIGFGKSTEGSLAILRKLGALSSIGWPILIGASRKTFIGAVLDLPVDQRLEGSLAVAAMACIQGAHIVRTHDVQATVRTVRMIDAIRFGRTVTQQQETPSGD